MFKISTIIQKIRPKTLRHPLPVRIYHWIHAPSLLLLLYSGLHISHPRSIPGLTMRSARCLHFISQFLFLGSLAGRVGHSIKTGDYRQIIPEKRDWAALPALIRYELFLTSKEPTFPKFNPIQKLYLTIWLPLFALQAATGAALFNFNLLGPLEGALGGLSRARRLHHLIALALGASALGHIYFSSISGVERLKSIFAGYKAAGKK